MNSFEIDLIFGDQALESVPPLEITVESESLLRSRIKEILQPENVTEHIVEEDGFRTILFTKSAEFKLPNGERLEVIFTYDEYSEDGAPLVKSGFDQYDIIHYQPISYDDEGRLNVRKRSFDLTFDAASPADTITSHSDEFVEVVPPGVRSSLMASLALLGASDYEVDGDALKEIIEDISSTMEFDDDMNKVTPEKLGYLSVLLNTLREDHRVADDQIHWGKSAR